MSPFSNKENLPVMITPAKENRTALVIGSVEKEKVPSDFRVLPGVSLRDGDNKQQPVAFLEVSMMELLQKINTRVTTLQDRVSTLEATNETQAATNATLQDTNVQQGARINILKWNVSEKVEMLRITVNELYDKIDDCDALEHRVKKLEETVENHTLDREWLQEMRAGYDQSMCRACFEKQIAIVCLPCGHTFCDDTNCVPESCCPACDETIESRKSLLFQAPLRRE